MKRNIILLVIGCLMVFSACKERAQKETFKEDMKAKRMLQGMWIDEDDEDVSSGEGRHYLLSRLYQYACLFLCVGRHLGDTWCQ